MAVWGWIAAGLATAGVLLLTQKKSAAAPSSRLPQISPGSRVLLIGDSLAVGLASPLGQHASADGVVFQGVGISGSDIGAWARGSSLPNALTMQPTIVLVSLGTNDAYMNVPDVWARQRDALTTLVQKIRDAGAKVVWIGPPTLPDQYGGNTPDRGFLANLRASAPNYLDSSMLVLPRSDGLHPTGQGYREWADAIWVQLA